MYTHTHIHAFTHVHMHTFFVRFDEPSSEHRLIWVLKSLAELTETLWRDHGF